MARRFPIVTLKSLCTPGPMLHHFTSDRCAAAGTHSLLVDRRCMLASSLAGLCGMLSSARSAEPTSQQRARRIEGMLIGSLIGDAAGGPVEFRDPDELRNVLPAARTWPSDARLTAARIREVGEQFRLLSYAELRPSPAPYAHWTAAARPGTITDDSRHKIPILDALRAAKAKDHFPITQRDVAAAYVEFDKRMQSREPYRELSKDGLAEYVRAARWVLGDRDPDRAAPVERLWSGVATNAGQMALLPLAGALAGDAAAAYRAAYQLGFMDNGPAKDINSALVAGLAYAVGQNDEQSNWADLIATMKTVDPYGYSEIPFVQRPTSYWLKKASDLATRADGRPKQLYRLLEEEGDPRYFWDAHFVLLTVFAILELCQYDPLCSLQLSIDFGHDTDSAAQLLGALVGAMHGPEIFPQAMRDQVATQLSADYDQHLEEWVSLLLSLTDRKQFPNLSSWEAPPSRDVKPQSSRR